MHLETNFSQWCTNFQVSNASKTMLYFKAFSLGKRKNKATKMQETIGVCRFPDPFLPPKINSLILFGRRTLSIGQSLVLLFTHKDLLLEFDMSLGNLNHAATNITQRQNKLKTTFSTFEVSPSTEQLEGFKCTSVLWEPCSVQNACHSRRFGSGAKFLALKKRSYSGAVDYSKKLQ